jgi:hypothetical protein
MQQRMRSFLLGTMPDEARRHLEEEFFESDDVYEDLQDSLNDLLDEYARGELDEQDRRRLEDRLLGSPRNRVKLELSRALAEHEKVHTQPARTLPRLSWTIASVAAACIAVAIWIGIDDLRVRKQLAANTKAVSVALAPEIASVTLQPQLARGTDSAPSVAAPTGKAFVKIELATEEIYPSYSVEVETADRGRIWTQSALARQTNGVIDLWLPGELITPGSYEFLLYGNRDGKRELLGSYPCRFVAAKPAGSPTSTKPAQ